MLQTLMTRMKGMNFITPVDIIRRVTATEMNSSGIRLGEFKDVMLNMMSDLESEYSLNSVVKRIVQKDLMKIYREKHTKMVRISFHLFTVFVEDLTKESRSLFLLLLPCSVARAMWRAETARSSF